MPDWSYRTIFRPVLFALPAGFARDVALGTIGTLARTPLGPHVIDFMGHMAPAPELAREVLGRRFAAPVGFAGELDPSGYALPGLSRFGVGFVELGPLVARSPQRATVRREDATQTIHCSAGYTEILAATAIARLQALGAKTLAIVRLRADADGVEAARQLAKARYIDVAAVALHVPESSWGAAREIVELLSASLPVLVALAANTMANDALALIAAAQANLPRCSGVLIVGTTANGDASTIGPAAFASTRNLVRTLREHFTHEQLAIVAGGGVHEPQQALDVLDAGADLLHIDSGLVYSGPGLIKRINEALLCRVEQPRKRAEPQPSRFAWYWFWLMGLAMLGGGTMALGIAGTRVVLPYDEHFVGMTRAELDVLNPRLLAFMTHDRVTLAGTMLSVGILYSGLALYGVRRGFHWAWKSILISALVGFFSFFSFLGFGYLEPFHAFVTTLLFQLLLLGWHAPLGERQLPRRVPLVEEWRWRLAQWGQLLLVIEALTVLVAGIVISIVGSTTIFVREDLEFMNTCAADLAQASPRLLALIAHDRATFGGMLMSCGLTTLMATLWGFAAGRAWLWSTLLYAGSVGYLCTLAVHYLVGYVDLHHLLPAYIGLGVHWLALGLAGPYLLWRAYSDPLPGLTT